jgi:hypothetical protein
MSSFAPVLVLAAAALHATWNLFAKRASGGLPFVFLVGAVNVVLYAPFVAPRSSADSTWIGPPHQLVAHSQPLPLQ